MLDKQIILNQFWSIYDTEGTVQALNWLESLKYYEEYCQDDIDNITKRIAHMTT